MARNWYLTVLVLAGIGSCWSQSNATVSDPCSKLTCYNGGTCVRRWESYATCVCKGGYTGTYCQYSMSTTTPSGRRTTYPNYCARIRCQNGGSCMNSDSGFWYCVCQPFTSGKYCEYKIDKPKETTVATLSPAICGGIQCRNGGSCQVTDSGYAYCICQIPYNGRLCENRASINYAETTTWSTAPTKYPNYCASIRCQNGGTCYNSDSGYGYCVCQPLTTGKYCEYYYTSANYAETTAPTKYPNYCASIWCQNGGTCYNSDSGYGYCVCQPLTTGKYCEYYYGPDGQKTTTASSFYESTPRYDPCVSNPCLNGGTCKTYSYGYSGYYCDCPSYAKGQRCQLSSVQEPPCKLRSIDFKWDDLEKFENVTETMCQQYCSADSRCQYWTYHLYWNVTTNVKDSVPRLPSANFGVFPTSLEVEDALESALLLVCLAVSRTNQEPTLVLKDVPTVFTVCHRMMVGAYTMANRSSISEL
ncbi:fibropellin-1-like [Lingula anatina]|uniref:Fibropellin-1-like n=1 Tax=Lingula anatina TaxID=7574 RepID=A0A1S3IF78_LINAN|nr:fibropellin-1-like [Lingula anatina]|eukprot:XP_013396798.1 fibropellin-1-like [Lingula anatina]